MRVMPNPADWVPMRWPKDWRDPARLGLVQGTPVNCLVVDWAAEAPPDFAERARVAGIHLLDMKDPAVASTGRAKAPWSSPPAVLALTDAVWPSSPLRRGGGGADSGPTGMPWVDANGWLIQLARTRAPGTAIWTAAEPPAQGGFVRSSSYVLAIADAEAYGARWVLALDAPMRDGLAANSSLALDGWKNVMAALGRLEANPQWRQYRPVGVLGVISDFGPPNDDLSCEILNLAMRRGIPFRIIERARAAAAPLASFKALIYADEQPPAPGLQTRLLAFVRAGGLLVAGSKFPRAGGRPAGADTYGRYDIEALGGGRIARAKTDAQDPYLVAADTQLLMSHRNDLLRVFNTGTLNCSYTAAPDGRAALLQIVNYAMRPAGHPVSVAFSDRYRAARLRTLEAPAPTPLELFPAARGQEIHLPPFGIHAAVELER